MEQDWRLIWSPYGTNIKDVVLRHVWWQDREMIWFDDISELRQALRERDSEAQGYYGVTNFMEYAR